MDIHSIPISTFIILTAAIIANTITLSFQKSLMKSINMDLLREWRKYMLARREAVRKMDEAALRRLEKKKERIKRIEPIIMRQQAKLFFGNFAVSIGVFFSVFIILIGFPGVYGGIFGRVELVAYLPFYIPIFAYVEGVGIPLNSLFWYILAAFCTSSVMAKVLKVPSLSELRP